MSESTTASGHIRHEILVSAISNTLFNGVIAWLLLKNGPSLRWSGDQSFVVDIFATGFLLPFIVALIVIPLQRGKLQKGKLQSINLGNSSRLQSIADRFPANTFKNALVFALLGIAVIAPLTLLGFYLAGVEQASPLQYAIFKGLWAGLIAGILVVPMVLVALRGSRPTQ